MSEKKFFLYISFLIAFVLFKNQTSKAQNNESNPFYSEKIIKLEGQILNYSRANVKVDNDGNFIVADQQSGMILLFDSDGVFLKSMGRAGRGPGEFIRLSYANQLSNGNYLAVDLTGRLSLFDSYGQLVRSYVVPVGRPLMSFVELDENFVLIPGMIRVDDEPYLLHKLDLQSGDIVNSFFKSPFQLGDFGGVLHSTASLVNAITDGEFIYAFITFLNQMHIFDYGGNFIKSIEIDYQYFSILEEQEKQLNREELLELATSHSLITDLIWKSDTTLIVPFWQFTHLEPPSGMSGGSSEGFSSFAEIDLEGNVLFERENTPRIFDFNKETNNYLLKDSLSFEEDEQRVIKGKRK